MEINSVLNVNWDNFKDKYNESNLTNKKLPKAFDIFDIKNDFINVYEPAEDSFLLIDILELEIPIIVKSYENEIKSIEVGCGSGLVSYQFLNILKKNSDNKLKHYCIDINADAISLTNKLLKNTNMINDCILLESNLFEKVSFEFFDIIIFNPPYVTTEKDELDQAQIFRDISASWAGGFQGSEIIFKFINQLESVISKKCLIYLLLSRENDYKNIIIQMKTKYNFECECLLRRKSKNESLGMFKFTRKIE